MLIGSSHTCSEPSNIIIAAGNIIENVSCSSHVHVKQTSQVPLCPTVLISGADCRTSMFSVTGCRLPIFATSEVMDMVITHPLASHF